MQHMQHMQLTSPRCTVSLELKAAFLRYLALPKAELGHTLVPATFPGEEKDFKKEELELETPIIKHGWENP